MTWTRTSAGLLAVALAAGMSLSIAAAEVPHKAKRSTPARTVHAAPDVTSTIGKPTTPDAPQPEALPSAHRRAAEPSSPAEDVSIPPPFILPAASRARVRACGTQWRDMKMAGTTGDDDWRDFAMRCFVEDDPKAATAP